MERQIQLIELYDLTRPEDFHKVFTGRRQKTLARHFDVAFRLRVDCGHRRAVTRKHKQTQVATREGVGQQFVAARNFLVKPSAQRRDNDVD